MNYKHLLRKTKRATTGRNFSSLRRWSEPKNSKPWRANEAGNSARNQDKNCAACADYWKNNASTCKKYSIVSANNPWKQGTTCVGRSLNGSLMRLFRKPSNQCKCQAALAKKSTVPPILWFFALSEPILFKRRCAPLQKRFMLSLFLHFSLFLQISTQVSRKICASRYRPIKNGHGWRYLCKASKTGKQLSYVF